MVTRNPALTLRWYDKVGSIETSKFADLLLVHRPASAPPHDVPASVYRSLIDSTERDVELVLVGGDALAGDVDVMSELKPADHEVVSSAAGHFHKAVDVTTAATVPQGDETLAQITAKLDEGVTALGGDHPPAGGGPGPPNNTYSYLKAHVAGGGATNLTDTSFRELLASFVGVLPDGSLNLERVGLEPLFEGDDILLRRLLHGDVDRSTGLVADPTPPYKLYPANLNFVSPAGNPLAGALSTER
jgi:hypothetical protein